MRKAQGSFIVDELTDLVEEAVYQEFERISDPEGLSLDFEVGSSLEQLQVASINYRIAIGPHAGRKALTLYSVPPLEEEPNIPLLAGA
jgi:methylmalonyl-CoA mutase N-terminal domain/subunit